MVVVTGKGGCDLCPVGVHLRVDGWIYSGRKVAIQPAAVPVIVDDDIHSRGDSPVNRLFDLRHVSGIDLMVWLALESHAQGMRTALNPALAAV